MATVPERRGDRDTTAGAAIQSRRGHPAVGIAVLLGATLAGLMSAVALVVDIDVASGAQPPYQTDDVEPAEPDDPPEDDDDPADPADPSEDDEESDETPDEDSEPAPEPGEVPVVVWVGAGALVIVAIIWGVSIAGTDQ